MLFTTNSVQVVILAFVFLLGLAHRGAVGKHVALENSAVPYIPPENELYDFMNVYVEGTVLVIDCIL